MAKASTHSSNEHRKCELTREFSWASDYAVPQIPLKSVLLAVGWAMAMAGAAWGETWPELPDRNGAVEVPAQEWPLRPGPRTVKVLIHYPRETRDGITNETGLMLTLHNWGGVDCVGTADPSALARRLNVVALCVNYLQSGPVDSIQGPEPYDFGYLQSLDALRALWWLRDRLQAAKIPFDDGRIYATGGSGGGNVTLMAGKLAPRTFTCLIDLCGMKKLTDDVAFNLPGGSELNARWSRDPHHPYFLTPGHKEIRFVASPEHLWTMKTLGAGAKTIVVHGTQDDVCPFADATEFVRLALAFGLDVEPRFIKPNDLDGVAFTSAGHSLGNRTEIVFRVAEKYLSRSGEKFLRRTTPTDFDRRDDVHYRTSDGEFVISYRNGYPIGEFRPKAAAVPNANHIDLTVVADGQGKSRPVMTPADWAERRRQIVANFELAAGPLPGPEFRVPLDVEIQETVAVDELTRIKLSFQSDPYDRVSAYLLLPKVVSVGKTPAMLCLHQTFAGGKKEPAGLEGDRRLHYALELARRGYVTLAPDYPSFGEHSYDFGLSSPYASGTMKAVWDNIRAVDLLITRAEVDPQRIGVIGHSLGGHNAIFTALFDERLKVVVSSCGFSRFHKDDVPSWTGPRYMPRIAADFGNDPDRVPFDFPELIGAIAPRAFFASATEKDSDFDVTGVRETISAARSVFKLLDAADRLEAIYPDSEHAFPDAARNAAYAFIDRILVSRQE